MSPARITYAGAIYRDMVPLAMGMVGSATVDLEYVAHPVEELLTSADAHQRYDITEFSLGRLLSLAEEEPHRWAALPVFPARAFRHSAIYVLVSSGITDFRQLAGCRIGVPRWTQTAGIWARGLLQEHFGIDLHEIEWVVNPEVHGSHDGAVERVDQRSPSGYRLDASSNVPLRDQLLAGRIDAVISAQPLPIAPGEQFRHVVDDVAALEADYLNATGIFPIMHAVVVERARLEASPSLAHDLVDLFHRSKEYAREEWGVATPVPFSGLAWENSYLAHERLLFGPARTNSAHEAKADQEAMSKFLDYAISQEVCSPALSLTDLFIDIQNGALRTEIRH